MTENRKGKRETRRQKKEIPQAFLVTSGKFAEQVSYTVYMIVLTKQEAGWKEDVIWEVRKREILDVQRENQ